ncbi:N-acetyltransferase [Erythrobacter sp. SDW2]|uniref:GNAT family N-acetyltransferase n=1 Tax=Erythrobacter sp. SDW2 TaxID=2907154 RepID=UPI001F1B941E|nr:GNAT family N-acetyltransferase [Erythrobacter sp. SDW2]UIP07418.1 N-acetyltransferase [Erythrobacter sp. SDW2]
MSDSPDEVTILHHVVGQGGKYVAQIEGSPHHGMLEWEPSDEHGDEVRIATHTVVPKAIGGRGIAALLVERFVADARRLGFRIVPRCSYVAQKFEEHPDWADLRA